MVQFNQTEKSQIFEKISFICETLVKSQLGCLFCNVTSHFIIYLHFMLLPQYTYIMVRATERAIMFIIYGPELVLFQKLLPQICHQDTAHTAIVYGPAVNILKMSLDRFIHWTLQLQHKFCPFLQKAVHILNVRPSGRMKNSISLSKNQNQMQFLSC